MAKLEDLNPGIDKGTAGREIDSVDFDQLAMPSIGSEISSGRLLSTEAFSQSPFDKAPFDKALFDKAPFDLIEDLRSQAYAPSPAISELEWKSVLTLTNGRNWSYSTSSGDGTNDSHLITVQPKGYADSDKLVRELEAIATKFPGAQLDRITDENSLILTLRNVHRGEGNYFNEVTIVASLPQNA